MRWGLWLGRGGFGFGSFASLSLVRSLRSLWFVRFAHFGSASPLVRSLCSLWFALLWFVRFAHFGSASPLVRFALVRSLCSLWFVRFARFGTASPLVRFALVRSLCSLWGLCLWLGVILLNGCCRIGGWCIGLRICRGLLLLYGLRGRLRGILPWSLVFLW